MTENRKTLFMLVFATVLTVIALVYGFSTIPNPTRQRELKLDHRRVSDLGELQYSIEDYYRNNRLLPASLSDVAASGYSYSGNIATTDPVTNQPYEYSVLSETTYQLCATFTTDSTKEEVFYDSENYNYSTYKSKFEHPQGRKCFDLTAPAVYDNYQDYGYPTPTFYMLPPEPMEILPTATPQPGTAQ